MKEGIALAKACAVATSPSPRGTPCRQAGVQAGAAEGAWKPFARILAPVYWQSQERQHSAALGRDAGSFCLRRLMLRRGRLRPRLELGLGAAIERPIGD